MKVAALIVFALVAGAFADDAPADGIPPFVCTSSNSFVCTFQELGHKIKYHANKLGGKLADVGQSILSATLDQGKDLLANGAQAVLGTVLEHLNKEGLVGKREVVSAADDVAEEVKDGVSKLALIKGKLHENFKNAVDRVMGVMKKLASLKDMDGDEHKKLSDIVAEFKQKHGEAAKKFVSTVHQKLAGMLKAGMDKLKAAYQKKMETRAVLGFDSFRDLLDKAKGHLSTLGGAISDTFKPHLDALKAGVATLANKAKEHAGNLLAGAKQSLSDLSGKLQGHVDQLKGHAATLTGHAKNALAALQDAFTDIAKQALENASGVVNDAVKTGSDAVKTVVDHVNSATGN